MNLRELVAELECGGKPEHSEDPVMAITPDGVMFEIKELVFEKLPALEGLPVGIGHGTVWLKVEES